MNQIYLARRGKIYGPYSLKEYDSLCARGEADGFSWIWDSAREQWKALDPAPQMRPNFGDVGKKEQAFDVSVNFLEIEAICFTPEQSVVACLKGWTETACEIEINGDRLMLAEGQWVTLHLWNPSNDRAMNVVAQVTQRLRSGSGWCLRLRWAEVPEVLLSSELSREVLAG